MNSAHFFFTGEVSAMEKNMLGLFHSALLWVGLSGGVMSGSVSLPALAPIMVKLFHDWQNAASCSRELPGAADSIRYILRCVSPSSSFYSIKAAAGNSGCFCVIIKAGSSREVLYNGTVDQ